MHACTDMLGREKKHQERSQKSMRGDWRLASGIFTDCITVSALLFSRHRNGGISNISRIQFC